MKAWKLLACGILTVVLVGVAQAGIEERRSFDTDRLTVRNLIGEVRIERHTGSSFEVVVSIDGKDAEPGKIELDQSRDELTLRFPAEDYVYPGLGSGSDVTLNLDRDSDFSDMLLGDPKRGRIKVRGSGSGLSLWADVTIRVPDGSSLQVGLGVGRVAASAVDAELNVATKNGDVTVDDGHGELSVATGSGDVGVRRHGGAELKIATGSGDVRASDCDGERFRLATGSGDIEVTGVRGERMQIGTGSGDVVASAIRAESVSIGTGSGEVVLELEQAGDGKFDVGTGSGDIRLTLPRGLAADVHAETDGGRVRVELSGDVDYRVQERDEVRLALAGGDGARVNVGSGNGDIRIED